MNLQSPEYVEGHGLIKGKSVLITAAAGAGIGFSAATRAAEEGARAVILSDIHEGRLEAAVEKLKSETGLQEVFGKVGNVAIEDDVQALVDFAEAQTGGIDILINNAGLGTSKRLIEMEDDEWNRVIDVTLNGTMRMTRAMMTTMKARGQGGVIVNNASVAGLVGLAMQSAYSATKHGVVGMTKVADLEAAPEKVRVNAICPGATHTPILTHLLEAGVTEDMLSEMAAQKRLAQPEEVAAAACWLLSDEASFMTGVAMPVDGGWTAQ